MIAFVGGQIKPHNTRPCLPNKRLLRTVKDDLASQTHSEDSRKTPPIESTLAGKEKEERADCAKLRAPIGFNDVDLPNVTRERRWHPGKHCSPIPSAPSGRRISVKLSVRVLEQIPLGPISLNGDDPPKFNTGKTSATYVVQPKFFLEYLAM